ncbi:hypothetical protein INS49_008620 [Diaporthe citri]|uniref:uncharacterized protein n=1 Tax=Diaporthe citri TaxID=83186 RepID=UPI001C824681|nr:uncharacterized protein INS49_008620 [Diaporthe citri]KAG6363519.1 hypothetical protein INS49_008620 [Diaporthe citri]
MANAEREHLFGADKLEDMCKKRSEEYQRIKANHEAWCVDQQQKQQMETEELEDELRQLKKHLSDVELEDSRATEKLGQLLSRPWMHREGSPDIEALFAEADRWNSDLCRIRADRDRPGEKKDAIVRDIEKVQNKLEGLPAAYALIRKEETRRLREQLEDLWHRQNQPDSLTTSAANDVAQRQTSLLTGASSFAAEGFSESTGSARLELAENRPSSIRRAQADAEAIIVTAVQSARREEPNPYDIVSGSESESDEPLAKRHKKAARTIHFDQVNAEKKNWRKGEKIYRISEHTLNSKKWYIFRCKKHCTGLKDGRGAAKHLMRQRNGHPERHWTSDQAVKELGVRVVGCDPGKRKRNNDAFDRAVGQGYRPSRRCNNRDCPVHAPVDGPHRHSNSGQRQSEDLEDSDSDSDEAYSEMPKSQRGDARAHELWQQLDPSPTVLDPIPGEIYQAYWASDHSWYPVAVLPWGDLRGVGLAGSLDETALFNMSLPTCFAVEETQDGLRIVGWKRDFELHHRRVSERKFPCMFFEGISAVLPRDEGSPQPQNLAWVMAKHLRPINYRHLDGQFLKEDGLDEAKAFRQRVIMLKSKATQEPPRFSPPLVDDGIDLAGARETHKGVKIEPGVDSWL